MTAVGDALGLPYEGVSRRRLPRLLGAPSRHRFLFGRGMISDDTEHTCLVAQSLISNQASIDSFQRDLAKRLRWWFASLPAGIGRATLKACLKLWCGAAPNKSGVFSAGNGPAMRSAIFGAAINDVDQMVQFLRASARITHTDPKAEYGAIAVAYATHFGRTESIKHDPTISGQSYLDDLAKLLGPEGVELISLLQTVIDSVGTQESTLDFAKNQGFTHGISGYTYHTVPIAIHAWLSHPYDYRAAVSSVIQCGGDADTTAAIVGGVIGSSVGESGIPTEWLSNVFEWPRSVSWMRRLGIQLSYSISKETNSRPIRTNFLASTLRNMLFLSVVLFHGFRRLLPPY